MTLDGSSKLKAVGADQGDDRCGEIGDALTLRARVEDQRTTAAPA
jgi:hypothetical protein